MKNNVIGLEKLSEIISGKSTTTKQCFTVVWTFEHGIPVLGIKYSFQSIESV